MGQHRRRRLPQSDDDFGGGGDGEPSWSTLGIISLLFAIEVILGLYLVVGDAMQDSSATSFGTALFVLGAVLVGAAHLLHIVTGEPPQTTPGPSSFAGRPSSTVRASTWAPTPAGPYAPVTGNPLPMGPPPGSPGASGGPGVPGGPAPLPPPPPPPGPGGSAF